MRRPDRARNALKAGLTTNEGVERRAIIVVDNAVVGAAAAAAARWARLHDQRARVRRGMARRRAVGTIDRTSAAVTVSARCGMAPLLPPPRPYSLGSSPRDTERGICNVTDNTVERDAELGLDRSGRQATPHAPVPEAVAPATAHGSLCRRTQAPCAAECRE